NGSGSKLAHGGQTPAAPAEIWKLFSGEKAFEEVRKQVEIGPRPAGSSELEKARALITASLQSHGWEVQRQEFTNDTPRGPVKFCNLIGRFPAEQKRSPSTTTQRAIVCSHFDTKRYSTIQFLGANDGASSTGALIELARVLAMDPQLAQQVELVFFDGEEAFAQFTETDGLYGSRYYAADLRKSGRAAKFKFGILWDMIGEKDLTITLSPDSPKELASGILATAESLGLRKHFSFFDRSIWDDHVPLNQVKIPTIDLIDFDFLYWHTADDTLDKLAPESLQKIGAITLKYLREQLGR
ncbi:MAG TPA: M28 family peptidase, partial [Chthoniobacteraceae bacterium]